MRLRPSSLAGVRLPVCRAVHPCEARLMTFGEWLRHPKRKALGLLTLWLLLWFAMGACSRLP